MAQFTTSALRADPYKNFRFRIKWEGRYVAGLSYMGELNKMPGLAKRLLSSAPTNSGRLPGETVFEAMILERGITHDPDFSQWANEGRNFKPGRGAELPLKDLRKDLIIEQYNEAGQLAITYKVYRCRASEYQALPDLDANANAIAIQHIRLENEGWEQH